MNWAEYVLMKPKSLEERRIENCNHYKKEKLKVYPQNKRGKKCMNTKQS